MARTPQRTFNQDLIVTSGDAITGDDATGGAGGTLELEGGDAAAASGAAGGSVIVHPGTPDGAGAKGIVNVRNNTGDADTTPILQLTSQGTNAEDIRLFVGTQDPNGTVSANPGDVYVRHNGTSSTVKVNTGAADANTTWTDLGGATAAVAGLPGAIYRNLAFYVDPSDRNSYTGSGSSVTDLMGNGTSGTLSGAYLDIGAFVFWGTQVWQVDDSSQNFVDESEDFLDAGTADWTVFPTTEAVADYAAFGQGQTFTSMTLDNTGGTAGVGGTVAWEYWNGTAWTALSGLSDGTSSFTAGPSSGQVVSWTLPTDWARTSIGGSLPLYYVRARITVVYTTNPIYDGGFVGSTADERLTFTKSASIDNIFSGGGTVVAFIRPRSDGDTSEGRIADTTDSADEGWFLSSISDLTGGQQVRFQRNFDGSTGGTWTSDNVTDPITGSSIRPVRLGSWTCVAVAYDDGSTANNPTMYVNGEEITNTENTAPVGSAVSDAGNSLLIGNRTSFDRTFDGHVSLVLLFDRILAIEEIRTIYNTFGRRLSLGQAGLDGGTRGGQRIFVVGGASTGSSDQNGGDILIQGGSQDSPTGGSARAGDVVIRGGDFTGTHSSPGRPGNVLIESGAKSSTGGSTSSITIQVGQVTTTGSAAGNLTMSAGDTTVAAAPGDVSIRAGDTTALTTAGGDLTVRGGEGGPGGDVFVRSGGVSGTASQTGDITISTDISGTGGTDTDTGAITITTSGTGATANATGDVSITTGSPPSTASGVVVGTVALMAGNSAGTTGSPGGAVTITSGNQTNTGTGVSNAGDITLNGGTCAKNTASARAGNIDINAGAGTGTNTSGGNVLIDAGVATGTGTAGALTCNAGASAGAVIGGAVTITAGQGGSSGTGGGLTMAAGLGGSASGTGGTATYRGGHASAGASNGGAATLTGGRGTTTGTGGLTTVSGGSADTTGIGGGVQISGAGGGTTSGNGGAINVDGGDAVTGNGGLVSITTGTATTSGTSGAFSVTTGNAAGAANASGGMTFTTGTTSDGATGTIAFTTSAATGTDRAAGDITFATGDSTGTAEGGDISAITGAGGTTGSGGDFALSLGSGGSTSGTGGGIAIACGGSNGASAAGGLTFQGGDAAGTGTGGSFAVVAGDSTSGTGGGISLEAGSGTGTSDGEIELLTDVDGSVGIRTQTTFTGTIAEHKTWAAQDVVSSGATNTLVTLGTVSASGRNMKFDIIVTSQDNGTASNFISQIIIRSAWRDGGGTSLASTHLSNEQGNGSTYMADLQFQIAVSTNDIVLQVVNSGAVSYTNNIAVMWTRQEGGFSS